MSIGEIRAWQRSFRVYAANDIYPDTVDNRGKKLLVKSLKGFSEPGDEAWRMKFVIRLARTPIVCEFDGQAINRVAGDEVDNRIWLVSVSGVDFAGRLHDIDDTQKYIKNWRQVYRCAPDGELYVQGERDFVPTGVAAKLDTALLYSDLQKMARLRFRAQDRERIEVVIETGIGLGVFSGERIGIGDTVRTLSAQAVKSVLEEEKFDNIKMVVFALPIFKRGGERDNYHFFVDAFKSSYKGTLPVLIIDQDMHKLARVGAKYFVTSELNPADSHGVFGEYWQNRGPGTEEKLALTTCGLLTQHHVVNPHVLNDGNYYLIDPTPKKK